MKNTLLFIQLVLLLCTYESYGVSLDSVVRFQDESSDGEQIYAPLASFSSTRSVQGLLQLTPSENFDLCKEVSNPSTIYRDAILLVPRGNCTFEFKTRQAQNLGAVGVLIHNRLESRYGWNETTNRVRYPLPRLDYECDNGGVFENFDMSLLDPPPYQEDVHDEMLKFDSPDNVCVLPQPSLCASRRCLVVNETGAACCAWDVPMSMAGDGSLEESERPDIVSVFLTMQQGDVLLERVQEGGVILVSISERYYPRFNVSSFLIWALATVLVWYASFYSARDYRTAQKTLVSHRQERMERQRQRRLAAAAAAAAATPSSTVTPLPQMEESNTTTVTTDPESPPDPVEESTQPQEESLQNTPDTTAPEAPPPQDSMVVNTQSTNVPPPPATVAGPARVRANGAGSNPNALELNVWHAAVFVVVASTLLLLLFYFEFYKAITVLYGIGCAGALAQILLEPVYIKICSFVLRSNHWWKRPIKKQRGWEEVTWVFVGAILTAYAIGAVWIYVGFTDEKPSTNTFFWVTQDIMGVCITILFLSIIQLNSIKVATVLLLIVFVYDIFFVFLTPYLFDGDSVMVTVATGGGSAESSDSNLCDKYPDESSCEGGKPLPMLFIIPRINDYRGGSSLLGLGDTILPGLLISFAARLDEAKRLVANHTDISVNKAPLKWYQGYLYPLVVAYGFGLGMAMIAVYLMEKGQPALLYIVPACLGTVLAVGWQERGDLWKGPSVLLWANRVVHYCHRMYPDDESQRVERPAESGDSPADLEQQQQGGQGSTRSIA